MTPRRNWLIGGVIAAVLIAAGTLALAEVSRLPAEPTAIAVQASTIGSFDNRDPSRVRFGALEFRGGLALSSRNDAFGGISAIRVGDDFSHFLSVTDKGAWLRGRIVYRDGKPSGIADAEIAPMLAADGRPLAAHGWYDTESLTERGGMLYVGIERVEKIVRFDYAHDGLLARAEPIAVPADFKTFKYNKSLECLAAAPDKSPLAGNLIVVTERSLDDVGNHRSFLLDGDNVSRFTVKRSDDYDVSDCAILPPGDLLLLERRYSIARGVAMRIRRISLASIKPGALVDGPALIEADLGFQIDNMEGISVNRDADGDTIITLVSDDNFSVVQRSLLLQFKLVGE